MEADIWEVAGFIFGELQRIEPKFRESKLVDLAYSPKTGIYTMLLNPPSKDPIFFEVLVAGPPPLPAEEG